MNSFQLIFVKFRQHRVAVLESCDNLPRPVFPFVGNCASFPDIFIEHQIGSTIATASFVPLYVIDEIHHAIFDSLGILCKLIAVIKKILLPFQTT